MKKFLSFFACALCLLILASCGGISTKKLAEEVKASMIETFAEDEDLRYVNIDSLFLVHESGNKYSGIAEISCDGEKAKLSVNVICDGDSFMWEITE